MDSQTEAVASDVESEPIGSTDGSTASSTVKSKPVFMGPGGVDSARVASNASSIEDDTQTGIFPAAVTRALRPSAINDGSDAGIDISNVSNQDDSHRTVYRRGHDHCTESGEWTYFKDN